jgi:hypothetical protein
MKEIIAQITKKTGITEEQARQAIDVISNFIGEKIPIIKGQLQSLFDDKPGSNPAPQVGGINVPGLG